MAENFYKQNGSYFTTAGKKILNTQELQQYAKAGGKEITPPVAKPTITTIQKPVQTTVKPQVQPTVNQIQPTQTINQSGFKVEVPKTVSGNIIAQDKKQVESIIDLAQKKETNLQNIKDTIKSYTEKAGANEQFVEGASWAAYGRAATPEEKSLIGKPLSEVIGKFGLSSKFPEIGIQQPPVSRDLIAEQEFVQSWKGKGGRLPTPAEVNQGVYGTQNPTFSTPQGTGEQQAIGQPTGGEQKVEITPTGELPKTGGEQPTDEQKPQEDPTKIDVSTPEGKQSFMSSIVDKLKGYLGLGEKTTTTTDTGLQTKSDEITKITKEANTLKGDLTTQGLFDQKELDKLGNQPIPMSFITGQQENLTREQKLDLMIKQNNYNNKLQELAIAQGDYDRAQSIAKQTSADSLEKAKLGIEIAKMVGDMTDKEADNALKLATYESDLISEKGFTPISDEQAKNIEQTQIWTDPVSNKKYLRPVKTQEKYGAGIIGEYQFYADQEKVAGKTPMSFDEYQTYDANRKARAEMVDRSGLDKNTASRVDNIANQFDSEDTVKNFNMVVSGANQANTISSFTQNPADNIAMIYAFAKVMDPSSVVREGEYNTVQKYAQSWMETFGFNAQRIVENKEFLSKDAMDNLKKTIQSKLNSYIPQYENVAKEYARRINKISGDVDGIEYLTDYLGGIINTGEIKVNTNFIKPETTPEEKIKILDSTWDNLFPKDIYN